MLVKKAIIFIILFTLLSISSEAQCAMCRAVLESEQGQATAKGINDGIIYLMAIPYILVGGIGYIIYLKFYKSKKFN
ncbi:MAG: hypothetical protein P8X62_00770 [Flavobacteriaceae bacterium]